MFEPALGKFKLDFNTFWFKNLLSHTKCSSRPNSRFLLYNDTGAQKLFEKYFPRIFIEICRMQANERLFTP